MVSITDGPDLPRFLARNELDPTGKTACRPTGPGSQTFAAVLCPRLLHDTLEVGSRNQLEHLAASWE